MSQASLHTGDQQGRWGAGVAAAESVHRQVDVLQGASTDVGGFGVPGQLGCLDRPVGGRLQEGRVGELGLDVTTVKPIGWSATTVPQHTAAAYAGQLEELAAALVLWRRHEHRIGTGTRARNLLAASCGCGRRIRVAKATLAEAPILCGACQQPFQPADPDEPSN
jgi:hypothetical protein